MNEPPAVASTSRSLSGFVESIARKPDVVALAAIALTVTMAWLYLIAGPPMPGMTMGVMEGMEMARPAPDQWSWMEGWLLFAMWAVMMVAMMLPSAAPVLLLVSRIGATRSARGTHHTPVVFFATGYLIVWVAFSAAAALMQWALHSAAVLSADMRVASPVVGGAILIAAGIYQWLPVKQSCLRHCRTPLGFLTEWWREGPSGALAMGMRHGAFCVGCCWMLMALLFVAGVMNLAWVAALSAIVLLEKVLPGGPVIARAAGIGFIVAGVALVR